MLNIFRRDTKHIPIDQRFTTIEALVLLDIQRRLRRKAYNIDRILNHSLFAIEDLAFNSMLIRNNTHLREIARSLKEDLPAELEKRMKHTEKALEELWDPYSSQYYSRNFITHHLIKVPTVCGRAWCADGTYLILKAENLFRVQSVLRVFPPARLLFFAANPRNRTET